MPGGGKGGGSSTVTVNNGPVTVDADSTVEIVGLDNIKLTAKLEPTPFKTESKQKLTSAADQAERASRTSPATARARCRSISSQSRWMSA